MAECKHTEHQESGGERVGRHWSDRDEKDFWDPCDTDMGEYVYCDQHHRAHSTGWCTVGHRNKIALKATDMDAAIEEARAMGLHILGE